MPERRVRRVFEAGTKIDDLKDYMQPFAERLGYKFNTETEFVDEVLTSEIEILERDGDVYCPCRIRTGDPKEDVKIICPCLPFYREQFAAIRKCWCGLFIRSDVEDGADLIGVLEEPPVGTPVEVPIARLEDLPPDSVRRVKIGRNEIALARTRDGVFAISNVCRHAFGPLSEGFVDGHYVVCPWHGWRYDLRDGTTDHPNASVRTYEVRLRDGIVLIAVPFGKAR